LKPLIIILKTLIVGYLWSIVFIDGIRVVLLINWHFDIFLSEHWRLLSYKWNSGDKEGGVLAVESWYSWNSLDDYTDNIYSIRNAYYGSLDGTVASASLCSIMKKVNPTLNDMVVKQIQETITAINDIPHPFRNNLGATTEVKNAQNQFSFLFIFLFFFFLFLSGE